MPKVINQSKGTVVAERVQMAAGLWSRFWGLMFRKELPDGHGLYLRSTYSIHTAFMRFPIDVIFVGKDGRVRKVAAAVKPFRVAVARSAAGALELPAGAAVKANVEPGDVLVFADAN
jgi:uncharacterized membrane protein (UPF0127 family)